MPEYNQWNSSLVNFYHTCTLCCYFYHFELVNGKLNPLMISEEHEMLFLKCIWSKLEISFHSTKIWLQKNITFLRSLLLYWLILLINIIIFISFLSPLTGEHTKSSIWFHERTNVDNHVDGQNRILPQARSCQGTRDPHPSLRSASPRSRPRPSYLKLCLDLPYYIYLTHPKRFRC